MSYDQYTTLTATLNKDVTREQVVEALKPLLDYLEINQEDALEGFDLDDALFSWETLDTKGENEQSVYLHFASEVGASYTDVIDEAAQNLSSLLESAYFEVVNTDCPNPDDAKSIHWIGQGEALENAQREKAIEDCMSALFITLPNPALRDEVAQLIRSFPLPGESSTQRERER